jgi:membrane-associated phospholipid phosphatase
MVITKNSTGPAPTATHCNVGRVRNQRNEVALLERPQTTAPRPPDRPLRWRPLSPAHKALFVGVSAFYLAVIVAVVTTSRLVAFDWAVMLFKPYEHWPSVESFLNLYVISGQRGPSAIAVSAWLGWRCWRTRSMRSLLVLGVALVLLNMSVGAVKIGLGRLGPHYAHVAGSNELFFGGGIFPSGHTANAVVTWGVVAYLASRGRRTSAVLAGFMGVSVGLTTIYLGTHWVSDVLAGWAAGVLVMLALPLFEPVIASADERLRTAWADRRSLGAAVLRPLAPAWSARLREAQNALELEQLKREQAVRRAAAAEQAARVPAPLPGSRVVGQRSASMR